MKIYTIQDATIFPVRDVYYAKWEFVKNNTFTCKDLESYKWMFEHMTSSLKRENSAPVWGWVRYDRSRKSPDLNDELLGVRGKKYCCMTLDVPKEHCLASNFEMWCWVLNKWKIPIDENEKEDCVSLEESWERIFNLDFGEDAFWGRKQNRPIQVILPCIKKEWIVRTVFFCRRPKESH